jgi:hypothetical protein
MSHIELLHQLIEFSVPVSQAVARLADLSWDADVDLVELRSEHCRNVLSLFMQGAIAGSDVGTWANAIECREDVQIKTLVVDEVLYELANPLLTHPLTPDRGKVLFSRLQTQNEG